jgi:hypothetical protein
MDVNNYKEFLKKHTVALKQIAADPEKLKRFETWLSKWNEDIEEDNVESIKEMLYRKLNNKK